ncbi:hypothetical protein Tco_1483736 [Tanacetum coccineum]
MFQDFCYSDTVRPSRSDEVLKLKNFKKHASLQLLIYQIKNGMSISVPKSQVSQDGKVYKMAKRLCLVDDLKVQDNAFDADVDEPPVQDLALNVDNVFQDDQCDAFDSDVDEAPTAQTMFMANLSSADRIYDEAGLSYDSDILSEVQDHDDNIDNVAEYHEVHEMQNDVQPNCVVDSDTEYTSDRKIITYEQYVKDNVEQVVQSNVSFVPNDALILSDIDKRTKNKAKLDKTEHESGKREKVKVKANQEKLNKKIQLEGLKVQNPKVVFSNENYKD